MTPKLDFSFLRVTCDHKKIKPGSTFVACDGSRLRGVDFIPQAIENGATTIIADAAYQEQLQPLQTTHSGVQFTFVIDPRAALAQAAAAAYDNPAQKLRIIGITGTKGKSSITHLVDHTLRVAGHTTALIGGIANKIAGEAIESELTTPNSDFLHAFFAACVERHVDTVIMEVSSHALSLQRVHGIKFDAVGFTNLAQDHLDFYQTMENYCDAKAEIFKQLKPTGHAIINLDHPFGARVQEAAQAALRPEQIIYVSQTADAATTQLQIISSSLDGLEVMLHSSPQQALHLRSHNLFGTPYAYNIAMAALICQAVGVDVAHITQALATFPGTPGRLQLHTLKNGAKAFIDFAHSGPPMEAVLAMLRPLTDNLVVLFGCGGDKPKERRVLMPQAAARYADFIIITQDNPRTEDPLDIVRQIEENIPGDAQQKTMTILDRRAAIAAAVARATTSTSIVAILGKGHEPYQIIGTTYHHFDDYEEVSKF